MRRAVINAVAIIIFLPNITVVNAESTISNISVTTRVLPVVKYEVIHQENRLFITEENVEAGYIDVRGAIVLSVMSNTNNGYVMTFFLGRRLFKEVEVFYDGVSSGIGGADNEIFMPAGEMKYEVKEFSFRFYLSDILVPGIYDWPVAFIIQAV